MRAWEFITEGKNRRPEISIRHLDDLGEEWERRAAWHAKRKPLVRAMYANPAREHERIELEKARLDLEQQKAELAATRTETQAETREAINDMAEAGSKANQQDRAKVASMARAAIKRRKTDRQSDRRL